MRDLASQFAQSLGYAEEGALAGLLHDCGKYGDRFQQRLEGHAAHVDHWSIGAYRAMNAHALAAALAVYGHHIGLPQYSPRFFRLLQAVGDGQSDDGSGRTLSGALDVISERFAADGFNVETPIRTVINRPPEPKRAIELMMDVRFLYSCMVDADYLDTEAHFRQDSRGEKVFRASSSNLQPKRALPLVQRRVSNLATAAGKMSEEVRTLRNTVWSAALAAGEKPGDLWTLTAPTGSGKTLAMLAFALNHAHHFNKRRIIIALPYLSIIEQTAKEYRGVFSSMGNDYVLEHHSLAERDAFDLQGSGRLAYDNWDAPIVITTTVQLFESLFTERPGKARKLHRLADSVVILDEIQTLPLPVVVPTVASLAALGTQYRATVLVGTATQPAFQALEPGLQLITQARYKPQEVLPSPPASVARVKWQFRGQPQSWEQLALELSNRSSFLIIVNLKRHAIALAEVLGTDGGTPLFHLSTNMCPAHRAKVLENIRSRLNKALPTRVVATQCVEAGVDLDFPVLYRAWGPVDSLAQAAGRCNRAGLLPNKGDVIVFQPEEDAYPPGPYQQAASIAKALWRAGQLDLNAPETYHKYWERLYSTTRPHETYSDLIEAIQSTDFAKVAHNYKLINQETMQVLVPYTAEMGLYESLASEARHHGITRTWAREAQMLSVGMYRPPQSSAAWTYLEAVASHDGRGSGWWIYLNPDHYTSLFGLRVPEEWGLLLA